MKTQLDILNPTHVNPIPKDEDLGSLNEAMTRHYCGNRLQTRRGTVFHSGEVVAARLDTEGGWFRARVIETTAAAPHGEKRDLCPNDYG